MPQIEVVDAFRSLGIALVLGLLVGTQRQRSASLVAGVRTFSLVTIFGTCCAILATAAGTPVARPEGAAAQASRLVAEPAGDPADAGASSETGSQPSGEPGQQASERTDERDEREPEQPPDRGADRPAVIIGPGVWILAAGALGIVGLAVLGNIIALQKGHGDSGMSTEVAMLVMYAVGALAWLAPAPVPAGIGAGVAILLHAKDALHRFTERIGEKDVRAVLTFALITFIILPVVPDETYGPFDVINPHDAWRMVVLVVGISLAGYIAMKVVGRSGGALLAGLMGGLVSSTATTASAARQSRQAAEANGSHQLDNLAATMIMLATVVMYGRVLAEIAIVAPGHFKAIAPPVGVLGAVTLGLGIAIWIRASRDKAEIPEPENPTQLRPAIIFGVLYVGVLFVAAAAEHYFGSSGLYAVSAISGLTDMDAITLSSARLVQDDRLAAIEASRAILIAATANMVFKTGMIASLGSRGLLRRVAVLYGLCCAAALGLALLWPASR